MKKLVAALLTAVSASAHAAVIQYDMTFDYIASDLPEWGVYRSGIHTLTIDTDRAIVTDGNFRVPNAGFFYGQPTTLPLDITLTDHGTHTEATISPFSITWSAYGEHSFAFGWMIPNLGYENPLDRLEDAEHSLIYSVAGINPGWHFVAQFTGITRTVLSGAVDQPATAPDVEVPEPSTLALIGLGLAGFGMRRSVLAAK